MKVISAELTEMRHVLVSELFGRAEFRQFLVLTKVRKEPTEVCRRDLLANGDTKSLA